MNLLYSPGTGRIYDDLGYILLGIIVESITGVAFDKYCENEIFGPLAMSETMFTPHKDLLGRIVPTEMMRIAADYCAVLFMMNALTLWEV